MRFAPAFLAFFMSAGAYAVEPLRDTDNHRDTPPSQLSWKEQDVESYRPRMKDAPRHMKFDIDIIDEFVERFDLESALSLERGERRLAKYERGLQLLSPIDYSRSSAGVPFFTPEYGNRFGRSAIRASAAALDYLIKYKTNINSENIKLRARGAKGGARLVLTIRF